jgi:2-dehydro-3-deoxyphosphogalactonate aldolase
MSACPASVEALAGALVPTPGDGPLIVPGVIQREGLANVMRGEETQILGALCLHPGLRARARLALPGTHSKWAELREGRITGFDTFMTGELYAVLRAHSILGRLAKAEPAPAAAWAAFERGVRSTGGPLALRLFSARALVVAGEMAAETASNTCRACSSATSCAAPAPSGRPDRGARPLRPLPGRRGGVGPGGSAHHRRGGGHHGRPVPHRSTGRADGRKPVNRRSRPASRGFPRGHPARRAAGGGAADRPCPGRGRLRGNRGAAQLAAADGEHRTAGREFGAHALIGAGTVTSPVQVAEVAAAGGRLVVMPHGDAAVIRAAKAAGMSCAPGIATPTEGFAALAAGADALKLFPAELLGPPVLKAMRSVFPAGTLFLPVGGIAPGNMGPFVAAGAAGFGLGSALYRPGADAAEVGRNAHAFVDAWRALHSKDQP